MYGAEAEIEFRDYAAPLVNDEKVSKEVAELVKEIIGEENLITNKPKQLGADDFADYLVLVPGTYIQVGTRNEENLIHVGPITMNFRFRWRRIITFNWYRSRICIK